ncbi:MAG: response regulator [Syntrophorhabdaceae bacterium]|nr:response regulator [Syntrophorhabdaceae bacterium]
MDKGKINILFLDDEIYVLNALRRLFHDEHYNVFTATSGKEAIEILRKEEMAVIVSDQRMPEMSGSEFLEKAREISPDSIRIILTGYADVNVAIDAINRGGAYRYITKPWNDDELIMLINQGADTYRLIKENRYLTELTKKQNEELQKWNSELEIFVQQQTIELTRQNQELAKLNETLKKKFRDFISVLSNLNELRDKTIANHSNNVARLSVEIGRKMGLNPDDVKNIGIAAQLHDIGKIGISDIIISKEFEALSEDERYDYMKHPVLGQTAVSFMEELKDVGVLIRHHHESIDGSGFPDGIGGEAIPVGSRIIAIADRFVRIIGLKPGADAIEMALKKIRDSLNTHFDHKVFPHLVKVVKENIQGIISSESQSEVELPLKDLRPGMVISRDVKTGMGLLIMPSGMVIDEERLVMLKRTLHLDPMKTGVFVRVEST